MRNSGVFSAVPRCQSDRFKVKELRWCHVVQTGRETTNSDKLLQVLDDSGVGSTGALKEVTANSQKVEVPSTCKTSVTMLPPAAAGLREARWFPGTFSKSWG